MVAMESTGVYWKPLYNLFELLDIKAIIVNAAHMKTIGFSEQDRLYLTGDYIDRGPDSLKIL